MGDRSREAQALDGAGETYRELGRFDEAADFHRYASTIHRDLEDRWQLAISLDNLATALNETDAIEEAQRHWAAALSALADFDHPKAIRMRSRINATLETDLGLF